MSGSWELYTTVLLTYFGIYTIGCLSLNLQFGVAGLINFGFILFPAVGAYTAAVLTLGPASETGFQQYIGGASLPFPLPILAAALAGGLVSLLVGVISLRRLRRDYEAMVMLVIALIAVSIVTNVEGLVNGANGLSTVPKPLADTFDVNPYGADYQWIYVGLVAIFAILVYWAVHRMTSSPLGRVLRAVRDNEGAAAALGKNVTAFRLKTFVVGGALAAVSGALLVQFITSWSPTNWGLSGTFLYFAAVIIGGSGSTKGAVAGALLVPVVFIEAVRFIPNIGPTVEALRWVMIGVLVLVFLWFRPEGVIPARPRRFARPLDDRGADSPPPARARAGSG